MTIVCHWQCFSLTMWIVWCDLDQTWTHDTKYLLIFSIQPGCCGVASNSIPLSPGLTVGIQNINTFYEVLSSWAEPRTRDHQPLKTGQMDFMDIKEGSLLYGKQITFLSTHDQTNITTTINQLRRNTLQWVWLQFQIQYLLFEWRLGHQAITQHLPAMAWQPLDYNQHYQMFAQILYIWCGQSGWLIGWPSSALTKIGSKPQNTS